MPDITEKPQAGIGNARRAQRDSMVRVGAMGSPLGAPGCAALRAPVVGNPLLRPERIADINIDRKARVVSRGGSEIELTRTEFKLLQLLMEQPGHTLARDELMERVLGYAYEGLGRTLDVGCGIGRNLLALDDDERALVQPRADRLRRDVLAADAQGNFASGGASVLAHAT